MKFKIFPATLPITTSLSILVTIISIAVAFASGQIETTFNGWSLTIWIFIGLLPCWKLSVIPENNRPTLPISLALTIVTALLLIIYWNGLSQSQFLYQFLAPFFTLIIFYSLWVTFYLLHLTTDIFKYALINIFPIVRS